MALWLFITITSYFFFSLAYFGDKLVLGGPSNPKLYTFYVGALSLLVIFFIPFTALSFPDARELFWITLEAITYILGLYTMFVALGKFDVSRVMATIGAVQPIAILFLTWMFWGAIITGVNFLAFLMLLSGSVIISAEKKVKGTGNYLPLVLCSAVMFSLEYVSSKMVFSSLPFLTGLIWMKLFSFLFALIFLFDKKLRDQIFKKRGNMDRKTRILFLFTQSSGGIAGLLQSFAIALVPVSHLVVINSLRGIQYVFLFLITLFFSFFFPKILKEDISLKVIIQKVVAMALIVGGLAILVT